jgi:transcription-repair coupling factor (superfamily II helicase)
MNVEVQNISEESLAPVINFKSTASQKLIVLPTDKDAEKFYQNYINFSENTYLLPSWDTLTYDSFIPSFDIQGKRLNAIHALLTKENCVIVSSIKSISQKIFFENLEVIEIQQGQEIDFESFIENLYHLGYKQKDRVESKGTYAIRGGQVDVFPLSYSEPVRVLFDADVVEEIRVFNPITQRSETTIQNLLIVPASEIFQINQNSISNFANKDTFEDFEYYQYSQNIISCPPLIQHLPESVEIHVVNFDSIKLEMKNITEIEEDTFNGLSDYLTINISFKTRYDEVFSLLNHENANFISTVNLSELQYVPRYFQDFQMENVLSELSKVDSIYLHSENADFIKNFDSLNNLKIVKNQFTNSFLIKDLGIGLLNESDFLGRQVVKKKSKSKSISDESLLVPNTYVVHSYHGIGLYEGTVTKEIKGVEKDYLSIKFKGTDKLFVPSDQIGDLEVYVGGENPKLSKLGGAEWEKAKDKARQNAKVIANRVLQLYKLRTLENNSLIMKPDTPWQNQVESDFEFVETTDQLQAIEDVKKDLEKNTPMDRLIFGDVGYGKTEVALRAAIKVAFSGSQVAVLAPTTILVQQHIDTFTERLKDYPLNIKHLSRFSKKSEVKETLEGVKNGTVDILIGTHRILSDDIDFLDLKLVIIDEEHRFGVEDKDKLHFLSNQVHKLTLTATPIPRTLEQSLMGIRDTSKIETPPENRLDTLVHVGLTDESVISLAIQREISRGGQVFFVLNRIDELINWKDKIEKLFPKLRHSLLHGRLSSNEIEYTMQQVWDQEVDILFATTIVEAGIDLPKVNTLICMRSELLGMSQLYQLKGRVGRRGEQSFAYFFHKSELSIDSEMRLDAIKSIGQTSTGYSLAMKDLQLRGSGSILGDIQSGFIANVGLNIFNSYVLESLDETIDTKIDTKHNIKNFDCYWSSSIPKTYIDSDTERIDIYKRLEKTPHFEVDNFIEELKDRFGDIPVVTENLLNSAKIRSIITELKIFKCIIKQQQIELFPVDLTDDLKNNLDSKKIKFLFRNKRLLINFKDQLTSKKAYDFLSTNLSL